MVPEVKKKTLGGVSVQHQKNTKDCQTVIMDVPKSVAIPMLQHMGPPCDVMVQVGDEVKVGQVIGDSTAPFTVPVHASISGKVTEVREMVTAMGSTCKAVVIESDGKQMPHENVKPPHVTNREEFIAAVRASGMVGLGGASFPTHVKLNPKQTVDTLIINAAECEPYVTSDHRLMLEEPETVMEGIALLRQYLGIQHFCIGIEDNKPDAIQIFRGLAQKTQDTQVVALKSRYPQGAEKVIIYETTGRVVASGQLPADVGVLVVNITTVSMLAGYFKTGMPLVARRVTVDGAAVAKPQNVLVPFGTSFCDIIEFCGGYQAEVAKLLMGGPMMGITVYDDSSPLIKSNNAVLAFDAAQSKMEFETACIRCGRCIRSCPFDLMPLSIERAYEAGDIESLKALHVDTCMECGCCAYVCPAKRHLVMTHKLAKKLLRERAK